VFVGMSSCTFVCKVFACLCVCLCNLLAFIKISVGVVLSPPSLKTCNIVCVSVCSYDCVLVHVSVCLCVCLRVCLFVCL
jgi:hypothetical protein